MLLSLQARLLPFWVFTIVQFLFSSPSNFPLFSFLCPLILHQLVQKYPWLSPFALSYQLLLCLVFLLLSRCYTEHSHPTTLHFFIFYCSFWEMFIPLFHVCYPIFLKKVLMTFFTTLPCHLLYYFWEHFSHPLTKCCTISPFLPHNLHRGLSLVLSVWCFTQFVLLACSYVAHNLFQSSTCSRITIAMFILTNFF